ncbi:MAG: hypothetical protein ACREXK_10130 [Gammaproteobacteria bacterium]
MSAGRIVGLLFVFLAAGCAGLERVPPGELPQIGVTRGASVAPEPVAPPAQPTNKGSTPEPPQAGATASRTVAVQPIDPSAAPSVSPSTSQLAAKGPSPAAKTPAKLVAPPVPTERVPEKESAAPAPVKQAPPPLDLKSLEARLKETKAIGVFTKLALKNQVDGLLNQFRAFYQGRHKTTLAELRRPYDLMLLKVLALLQDTDPPLAAAIVASREAIWGILADPAKFATL